MIEVSVTRQDDGYIKSFTLSGHAESGPKGYDLVCAGVSAISFGAVNAVLTLCEVELDIEQAQEGGYLSVNIPSPSNEQLKDNIELLLNGMIVSLRTIEREYSEHIQIEDN
ncbi:MAG TPA: ribosomal-processing cysteine protease Prp [Bacillota bacterium]|nr:ribosomal-processing cysteine protease Prp [Bacillota bacterium]